MKKSATPVICLHFFLVGLLSAPPPQKATGGREVNDTMTNADVIRLIELGAAEAEIMTKIRSAKPGFDLSPEGLRRLRDAGVGDGVIGEMLDAQRVASASDFDDEGPAPCAPPPAGVRPAGDRQEFDRQPPSRFGEFIRPDDAATYRLPPAPAPDAERKSAPTKRMRIGLVRALDPPLRTSVHGKCFDLGHGYDEILWVVSEGARQVRVRFASVSIPPGAKLFVYSMRNVGETHGPYEGRGPSGDGTFWSPPLEGDGAVVEYYDPRPASVSRGGHSPFQITEVSHIY